MIDEKKLEILRKYPFYVDYIKQKISYDVFLQNLEGFKEQLRKQGFTEEDFNELKPHKTSEKKGLNILIFEDHLGEDSTQELMDALRNKGYSINKIDLRERYDESDKHLLSDYDVILSDLGFPTDYKLDEAEIRKLSELNASELKKLYDFYIADGDEKTINGSTSSGILLGKIKPISLRGGEMSIVDWFKERDFVPESWGNMSGFLPVWLQAKKINKKITFYTEDYGHASVRLSLGVASGIFSAEDCIEGFREKDVRHPGSVGFLITHSKKLIFGSKRKFEHWVKALEVAIESQT